MLGVCDIDGVLVVVDADDDNAAVIVAAVLESIADNHRGGTSTVTKSSPGPM